MTSPALEATCWLGLGFWWNNAANSHLSPGPFNRRVLRYVPKCSHTPHWSCHQRRLVNCDWMPASHTSGQPSNPNRHPTCRTSRGGNARHIRSRHPFVPYNISSIHLTTKVRRSGWITDGMRSGWRALRDSVLSFPNIGIYPPGMVVPFNMGPSPS